MPNDIANNMADTIHFLEEDNASMLEQLTNLQLVYNEQMIELRETKRLLKLAIESLEEMKSYLSEPYSRLCSEWCYADEAKKLLGEEI